MADLDELRGRVERETDLERWTAVVIEYVAALAGAFENDTVDDMLAEVAGRHASVPAIAIPAARRLADVLSREGLDEKALAQLERVLPLARDDTERIELLLELAPLFHLEGRDDEADATLRTALQLADARPPDDLTARVHLALVATDREGHARIALACARDPELRERATLILGNALFDRGDFDEALALPTLGLGTRALHEHVLRLQGRLADEPPAEELVLPYVAEVEPLPDDLIAFFTPPGEVATWTRSHPLGSSSQIRIWSHGEVTCLADLDSQKIFGPARSMFCACGRYRGNRYVGLVCECCKVELISNTTRASRSGHLSLHVPVLHPWFVPAAALLTGHGPMKLRAMPGPEMFALLESVNRYTLEYELEKRSASASERQQAALAPLVELVAGMRTREYFRPSDLALEMVPVLGPDVRFPGADMAKVRAAYQRLLVENDQKAAVRALFACFSGPAAADREP